MANGRSNMFSCKCRTCRNNGIITRRNLRKHPDEYKPKGKGKVKCPNCGDFNWAVDTHRKSGKELATKKANGKHCTCGELPYPHQRGSFAGERMKCIYFEDHRIEQSLKDSDSSLCDNPEPGF